MAAEQPDGQPLINDNPKLQTYYSSLESRIGYRIFLGGTRHFGYYERDTYWPFPIGRALRRMEDKLAELLALPRGAELLDAGCGVGHVALRLAGKFGHRVRAIDVTDHHVAKAQRNVSSRCSSSPGQVSVRKMDYHHLETLPAGSLDGAYTMETLVHATDPRAVLAGFHRVLRPGGRLALFEYDHDLAAEGSPEEGEEEALARSMRAINDYAAMPTNELSHPGVFAQMLAEAGFEDVVVRDYSERIRPMARLFCAVAYVPWLVVSLFGLERYFINTVAGVESYRGRDRWRYVAITATKPGGPLEVAKTR
ncbi:uncharacterized protein E0L32_004455 [Thyridium curvatum]|uniref:Methyltransferase type 11 domain-containing protein n=1 Tax=Thyridium curvatum TaxID=1093900 RepID=A0A507AXG3_9PEZI|nr:uncharacterized protein E0L32_004455 [Thyridium curvatum]TPX15475.1 hypothetical protein E0L32_004455 [Thyridium curvatum]